MNAGLEENAWIVGVEAVRLNFMPETPISCLLIWGFPLLRGTVYCYGKAGGVTFEQLQVLGVVDAVSEVVDD
jgi:hypothetical protein